MISDTFRFITAIFGLVLLAAASGAGIGVVAGIPFGLLAGGAPGMTIGAFVGAFLGAVQGLIAAPPVVVVLWRKAMWPALGIIYLPAAIIVIIVALLLAFLSRAMTSELWLVVLWVLPTIGAWAGCLMAVNRCPERLRSTPGHCTECDYDLRGNVSGICPECGLPVEQPSRLDEERALTQQYCGMALAASIILQAAIVSMILAKGL